MNKATLFLALLFLAIMPCLAQDVDKELVAKQAEEAKKAADALKQVDTGDKNWKFSGVVGTNAAATGMVNWAAGGKNNVNGLAFARLRLLWSKGSFAWDTNLDTEYGLTWIDQDEDPLQKSSDKINLSTKFGWEFKKSWYLTVLGAFQSQYAMGYEYLTGYNPVISKWLAPSYTDFSIGIDWKPNTIFSVYISPVAGRITTAYVSDKFNENYKETYNRIQQEHDPAVEWVDYDLRQALQEKYGTYVYNGDATAKEYRNARAEFGFTFKGTVNYKYEDFTVMTTLGLFTPYAWDKREVNDPGSYFKYRDNNRRFGNFDVDWDVAISYQLFQMLNVTLSTSLKYYNGLLIDKTNTEGITTSAERVQFKSVLGLGIGYTF